MKTKILVAALVCLSVGAVAQQSDSGQKPSSKTPTVTAPRDAASGMATGKKTAHDDWQATTAASSNPQQGNSSNGNANAAAGATVRESPSKASLGVRESPSKASTGLRESPTKQTTHVSAGDVNGDGMPDTVASPSNASGQNAAINTSHSNIKSRDLATGQASGKRQHQPVSLTKTSEDTPKK